MGNTDVSRERPCGVVVSCSNYLGGKLRILRSTFVLPSMPLPNLIIMWYCGYVPNNIPPYKMLQSYNVPHLKHGKSKLSNMEKMSHVERGDNIFNQPALIKKDWTVAHTFALYHALKNLFMFHLLRVGKKR